MMLLHFVSLIDKICMCSELVYKDLIFWLEMNAGGLNHSPTFQNTALGKGKMPPCNGATPVLQGLNAHHCSGLLLVYF